jgi:hypothetical protein
MLVNVGSDSLRKNKEKCRCTKKNYIVYISIYIVIYIFKDNKYNLLKK